MQLLKGLPLAVEQVHLSREQGGPRSSSGSSTGAPIGQHPVLQEQQYQALSSPEQPPANPAQSSSSRLGSSAAPSSFRQGSEPSTAPTPAAANGKSGASNETMDALSLAADLADAISAVNLTDVLTDDNPFATAKVQMPKRPCSQYRCPLWTHRRSLCLFSMDMQQAAMFAAG